MTMFAERPAVMTIGEVASYLRLHEQTVYKMAKNGDIPAFKVGNRWRFIQDDIDAWLRARRDSGIPAGGGG